MLVNEKTFRREWQRNLTFFDNDALVNHDQNLIAFRESDLFDDFVLADEIVVLHELIREECVRRVSQLKPCET